MNGCSQCSPLKVLRVFVGALEGWGVHRGVLHSSFLDPTLLICSVSSQGWLGDVYSEFRVLEAEECVADAVRCRRLFASGNTTVWGETKKQSGLLFRV